MQVLTWKGNDMSGFIFDSSSLIDENYEFKLPPEFIPEITPVSMIDVDRMPPMDMMQSMSDACPRCTGFTMFVGDYVCWGFCGVCYENAIKQSGEY